MLKHVTYSVSYTHLLRRCRLRENGGSHSCRFQSRFGQQASCRAGPDYSISIPALSNIFRTVERFSLPNRIYQPGTYGERDKGNFERLERRKYQHYHRHPSNRRKRCHIQRSRSADLSLIHIFVSLNSFITYWIVIGINK